MSNRSTLKTFFLASAATGLLAGTANASVLEEITVTAQKREQNVQDIGIAITAFSGDQLKALGMTNATDIVIHTPSLQLYEFSPSLTVYNLRGVSQNSFSDHLEAPVAVYMDDAYVAALGALNAPMLDVARVEVLKGPQGALYGRNATGGLIHYVFNRPTDEFEGYLDATYGSYDLFQLEGAISGPIVEDKVLARVAFRRDKQDGYLKSLSPGVRDAYGKDSWTFKSLVEVRASDAVNILLKGHYSKDDDVPTGAYTRSEAAPDPVTGLGYYVIPADDVHAFYADVQGHLDREVYGGSAKITWDVADDITVTSITDFLSMEKYYGEDTEGTENPVFNFRTGQDYDQFSQELRVAGDSGALHWQAGAYYLNIDTADTADVFGWAAAWTNADTGNFANAAMSEANLKTESWSVFGQADYDLTEDLKLTVGLRYTHDAKDFDLYIAYVEADGTVLQEQSDVPGFPITPICYAEEVSTRCLNDADDPAARYRYSDWAGKLQLDWKFSDTGLAYIGVSRGIKGGSWSAPSFADSVYASGGLGGLAHKEEVLYAYEGGVKLESDDGRLRFNTALFYYDYNDYQAFSVINFIQTITNNDASVYGAEFELVWNPTPQWDLMLGGAFLDTKVKDIITPYGLALDRELPQTPSVSINGLARYSFDVPGGSLIPQVDFLYNSKQWMEVTNAEVDREPGYFLANARLTFQSESMGYSASIWVKNLTDEEYRLYALDVSGSPTPFVNDVYAPPRTWGVTLSAKF